MDKLEKPPESISCKAELNSLGNSVCHLGKSKQQEIFKKNQEIGDNILSKFSGHGISYSLEEWGGKNAGFRTAFYIGEGDFRVVLSDRKDTTIADRNGSLKNLDPQKIEENIEKKLMVYYKRAMKNLEGLFLNFGYNIEDENLLKKITNRDGDLSTLKAKNDKIIPFFNTKKTLVLSTLPTGESILVINKGKKGVYELESETPDKDGYFETKKGEFIDKFGAIKTEV